MYVYRCLATPEQLEEGIGDPRCQVHTEFLKENFDSDMVWTSWGVNTLVEVSAIECNRMRLHTLMVPLAFHDPLPSRRYIRASDP